MTHIMERPSGLLINKFSMTLNDIIELQALNVAKIYGNTTRFIIVSLLLVTLIYVILKFKNISIKYSIAFMVFYCIIFGFLFFKGIRIKSMLDTGQEIIININDYKTENMYYPETLDKLDWKDKEFIDIDFLSCCVEYKVNDSTLVRVEDEKGFYYKKIPGESFLLIIHPTNYPVQFIYNSTGTDFEASDIHNWK